MKRRQPDEGELLFGEVTHKFERPDTMAGQPFLNKITH